MPDSKGIFEELLARKEELEKQLDAFKRNSEYNNAQKEEVYLTSAPFFVVEDLEGHGLQITGIALAEGVWKNVLYPADEIDKSARALKGKPLLVEHGLDSDFRKKRVGSVRNAYYDQTLRAIVFQALVTDSEAIKLVKDGTFPAVSCSTWVDKFPVNSQQSIGFNFNFNELSLVKTPACDKCFIFAVEELSRQENLNMPSTVSTLRKTQEEMKMTEDNDVIVSEEDEETFAYEDEEEEDLSALEKPSLYCVLECDDLSELSEELKKKAVSYYYGYKKPEEKAGKLPYKDYPGYPYKTEKKAVNEPYPVPSPHPAEQMKEKYGYPYPEKKSLWVVLECDSPAEIEALKKIGKKVKSAYYGYKGYPMTKAADMGLGYKYPMPEKKAGSPISPVVAPSYQKETDAVPPCKYEEKKHFTEDEMLKFLQNEMMKKFKCPICSKECDSAKELQDHIEKDHGQKLAFRCETCGREFASRDEFEGHQCKPPENKGFKSVDEGWTMVGVENPKAFQLFPKEKVGDDVKSPKGVRHDEFPKGTANEPAPLSATKPEELQHMSWADYHRAQATSPELPKQSEAPIMGPMKVAHEHPEGNEGISEVRQGLTDKNPEITEKIKLDDNPDMTHGKMGAVKTYEPAKVTEVKQGLTQEQGEKEKGEPIKKVKGGNAQEEMTQEKGEAEKGQPIKKEAGGNKPEDMTQEKGEAEKGQPIKKEVGGDKPEDMGCPECEALAEVLSVIEELKLPKDYTDFMKKCMKESKTMPVTKRMKACAEEYKKQAKPEKKSLEDNASTSILDTTSKVQEATEISDSKPAPPAESARIPDSDDQAVIMKAPEAGTPGVASEVKAMSKKDEGKDKKEEEEMAAKKEKDEKPEEMKKAKEDEEPEKEEDSLLLKAMLKKDVKEKEAEEKEKKEKEEASKKAKDEDKEAKDKEEMAKKDKEEKPEEMKKADKKEEAEEKKETPAEQAKEEKEKKELSDEDETYVKEHLPEVLIELIKKKKF